MTDLPVLAQYWSNTVFPVLVAMYRPSIGPITVRTGPVVPIPCGIGPILGQYIHVYWVNKQIHIYIFKRSINKYKPKLRDSREHGLNIATVIYTTYIIVIQMCLNMDNEFHSKSLQAYTLTNESIAD